MLFLLLNTLSRQFGYRLHPSCMRVRSKDNFICLHSTFESPYVAQNNDVFPTIYLEPCSQAQVYCDCLVTRRELGRQKAILIQSCIFPQTNFCGVDLHTQLHRLRSRSLIIAPR